MSARLQMCEAGGHPERDIALRNFANSQWRWLLAAVLIADATNQIDASTQPEWLFARFGGPGTKTRTPPRSSR